MSELGVDAEELLVVPHCRAVVIGISHSSAGEVDGAPAPVVQFAAGTLRMCRLPSSTSDTQELVKRVVLIIADDGGATDSATLEGGFYYPVLADMPVCKAGGTCLTLPDPDGEDNFGIIFGDGGLESVVALLEDCGCRVWQQSAPEVVAALAEESRQVADKPEHGKVATATVSKVQGAATAATGAIKMATGALSWGIRAATSEAKQSPLMAPTKKAVAVPSSVKETAAAGRQASHAVVRISSVAIESTAKLAGSMAGRAGAVAGAQLSCSGGGKSSNRWVADAKYVGGSTVSAAADVYLAMNGAADQLVQETLGSTADLVGHKLGDEAGATTREGFHVVGNVMEAKSLLSKKAVAKVVAKGTACEAARSLVGTPHAATPSASDVSAPAEFSPTGAIRLGPQ